MSAKPRIEYQITDTAVDALPDGTTALHFMTYEGIDLTMMLTADQSQRLRSQIVRQIDGEEPPSDPQ